jgi:hypothetical protein
VDTGERAIADYVAEAREMVAEEVDLPKLMTVTVLLLGR